MKLGERRGAVSEVPMYVIVYAIAAMILLGGVWELILGNVIGNKLKDQMRTMRTSQNIALLDTYQEGALHLDFSDAPYDKEFRILVDHDPDNEDLDRKITVETLRTGGGAPLIPEESETAAEIIISALTEVEEWRMENHDVEELSGLCVKKQVQNDPENPDKPFNLTFNAVERGERCTL